jgi:hypothetical protein
MGTEMNKQRSYNNEYHNPQRSDDPLVRAAEDELTAKLREKAKSNIDEARK